MPCGEDSHRVSKIGPSPLAGEGRDRAEPAEERICVGVIVGAQGVRGAVRIKPFTAEPRDVAAYGPVTDATGARKFRLKVTDVRGGVAIATLAGIGDRNAAEALKGIELHVPRAALPPPEEDEFYHADLIGLPVELEDGTLFGRVRSLDDYGAGDVIEVERADRGMPLALPFTRDFVPVVDVAGKRVVVAPPENLLTAGEGDERGADG